MQLMFDELLHSASDLTDFLACGHLSKLEAERVLAGERRAPQDEAAALIAAKGLTHEARFLQRLRAEGHTVIDLGEQKRMSSEQASDASVSAMASGATIIYQATLYDGAWLGRADFLRRVEMPSAHWAWSYEVLDTKLSLEPRPSAVMQLCMYSELLERVQGVAPERVHIVLGDGSVASYRRERFMAYYRALKDAFLAHLSNNEVTYPTPVTHCAKCNWSLDCEERRGADDHLSLVAWMRGTQITRLATVGITTMSALAQAADAARPVGMAPDTFVRLRRQAQLQRQAQDAERHTGVPVFNYELLQPQEKLGFAKLPPASPGDVYFDMEGDPLYEADRGLEYLFGNFMPENRFERFWAHTPDEEQAAFEACMDFFLKRLAADPHMHVYHYAPYEKTALRRLSLEYNTRIEEVDRLLRAGVFVDLYEIVRQGLMISQPSYSIKKLEPFYHFTRTTDVKKGDDSIVSFERWRADPQAREILDDIARYNDDDCRSTYELRLWLDARKLEAERDFALEISWNGAVQLETDAEQESQSVPSELAAARAAVIARLQSAPADAAAQHLLAALIPYHVREAKPIWWEYYDRCDNADTLTEEDGKALGGLTLDTTRQPVQASKRHTPIYSYTFPAQKFDGELGGVHDAYLRKSAGTLEAVEFTNDGGIAQVKVATKVDPASIHALIPHTIVTTTQQQLALIALGEQCAAGKFPSQNFVTDVLNRAVPRLRGFTANDMIQPPTVDGLAIADIIGKLERSYMVVQGPPGTGKTTTGAKAIVQLLARGLRVGITSRSHAAIDNLLAAIDRTAIEAGVSYRGVRKPQDEKIAPSYIHHSPNLTQQKSAKLFADDVQLVAGTSWAFVGKDVPVDFLDVLVIDEAGQVSLADVLALHAVTKNLVLLGDPLQLKQVARGIHPPGAGASVLEHLLGKDATIPPERGIFLDVSYRMHPAISEFVSRHIYERRLQSAPSTVRQAVRSAGLHGSGLRFAPIAHEGNSREAREEARWIVARIDELLAGEVTDRDGTTRALVTSDIMIVTPYNAQRTCIERMLLSAGISGIPVGTVDKFQGQEAAVVFYSMATSSGDDLPRDIAFLYEANRFNVAISRAKALCVLVASPALLRPLCTRLEEIEMVNLLCAYVEEAEVV